ncbi:MAG: S-methyl-5-thioribose-1-phosphate isomerase [Sphaerochaetaceae bacterium]|nr:S-methyl-5-thioribose-1-phosphate isomerase [Sphaerochaetaceae bacterium]MDD3365703.1 S-methyl-5-thioribose-1-phosphate isomerase [Sphaerochaetaceae bacterium]MDD4219528.1 S-methyl-5-thioribose-1-phosphate isomerase [Sphaerochaetaceae bacterium]MDY0370775.1 S-methyl-5-thioribose-1-phosphate isomerase [Sphaerochaetaceae bacterium]
MDETFITLEFKDNMLHLIDQRVLPTEYSIFTCKNYKEVEFAIRDMVVRGAPAIGATAAYGVVLAAREFKSIFTTEGPTQFRVALGEACDFLDASRPTAVNLHWALQRMLHLYDRSKWQTWTAVDNGLLHEADVIREEDIATNKALSKIGNAIVPQNATILTHCNTGALATAGWGTALGVIKEAFYAGKNIFVYADETRPRLQGARLTAWELMQANIPSKLISDSVGATLIRDGKIDLVILGGDRVAANGDVCNKIGTFMLSALCKLYGVPFYSVVPVSTIDFSIASGAEIPIEERGSEEVTHVGDTQIAPDGMEVYNPAFDVTPHQNITGIITEKGILYPPFGERIKQIQKEMEIN